MSEEERAHGDTELARVKALVAELDAALREAGVETFGSVRSSLAGVPRVSVPLERDITPEEAVQVTVTREDAVLAVAEGLAR